MVSWAALDTVLPAGQGRWSFPSTQHWWGHTWSAGSSSGLSSTRERQTYLRVHCWTITMMKRLDHLSYEERLRQLGLFSLEKRRLTRILLMCRNTWREGANRREPGSFQWCPVTEPEAMGTRWNTGSSLWTSGSTLSAWRWLSTGTGCPESLWSLQGNIQKLSGHGPGQLTLGGPAWAERLDQTTSRDPFQTQPFCDSDLLSFSRAFYRWALEMLMW